MFGQGEGHFYHKVNLFSFSPGVRVTLVGGKRAFLAEPSARPAINGRLDEMWGCTNEKKKITKKWEKKCLSLYFHKVRRFQPGREKSTR